MTSTYRMILCRWDIILLSIYYGTHRDFCITAVTAKEKKLSKATMDGWLTGLAAKDKIPTKGKSPAKTVCGASTSSPHTPSSSSSHASYNPRTEAVAISPKTSAIKPVVSARTMARRVKAVMSSAACSTSMLSDESTTSGKDKEVGVCLSLFHDL